MNNYEISYQHIKAQVIDKFFASVVLWCIWVFRPWVCAKLYMTLVDVFCYILFVDLWNVIYHIMVCVVGIFK